MASQGRRTSTAKAASPFDRIWNTKRHQPLTAREQRDTDCRGDGVRTDKAAGAARGFATRRKEQHLRAAIPGASVPD